MRLFYPLIPQRDYWHGGHFCVPSCYNVSLILSHEVLKKLERLIENFKNINAEDVGGQILNSHNSGGTRHGPLQNDEARGSPNLLPRLGRNKKSYRINKETKNV